MLPVTAQFALVAAAAVLAPIVVRPLRRFAVPAVIFEITLGIVLGPQVLNLVNPGEGLETLSELGLCMLMFLAGYELKLSSIAGEPLRLSLISWACPWLWRPSWDSPCTSSAGTGARSSSRSR